jgi:hypothetical protein
MAWCVAAAHYKNSSLTMLEQCCDVVVQDPNVLSLLVSLMKQHAQNSVGLVL